MSLPANDQAALTRVLFVSDPGNPAVQAAHWTAVMALPHSDARQKMLTEIAENDQISPQVWSQLRTHPIPWIRALLLARGDVPIDQVHEMIAIADPDENLAAAAFRYVGQLDDDVLTDLASRAGNGRKIWVGALLNLDGLSLDLALHAVNQIEDAIEPVMAALAREDIAPAVVASTEERAWRRISAACSPAVTHEAIRKLLSDPSYRPGTKAKSIRARLDRLVEARPDLPDDIIGLLAAEYWRSAGGPARTPDWVYQATSRVDARAHVFKQHLKALPADSHAQQQLCTLFDRMSVEDRASVVGLVLNTRSGADLRAHVVAWLVEYLPDHREREDWILENLEDIQGRRGEPWMADYPRVLLCTYRDHRKGAHAEVLRTIDNGNLEQWLTETQFREFTDALAADLVAHPQLYRDKWVSVERVRPLTSDELSAISLPSLIAGLNGLSKEQRRAVGPRLAPVLAGVLGDDPEQVPVRLAALSAAAGPDRSVADSVAAADASFM